MLRPASVSGKDGETYQSRKEGFSITGPPGWTMTTEREPPRSSSGYIWFLHGSFNVPVQFRGPLNMAVMKRKIGSMSLDEYVNLSLVTLEIWGAEIVSQNDVTIGELDAQEIIYTHSPNLTGLSDDVAQRYGLDRDRESENKWVVLVKGKTGYVITYRASVDLYDEYIDEFDASVATFRVIDRWIPNWLLGALLMGTGFAVVGGTIAWRRCRTKKR